MKYLITIILLSMLYVGVNESKEKEKFCSRIKKEFIESFQSSSEKGHEAENAVDNNLETFSKTKEGKDQWYLSEFQNVTKIKEVEITTKDLGEYYLFFTKAEFIKPDITELIKDPWVKYVHVKNSEEKDGGIQNTKIPIDDYLTKQVLLIPVKQDPIHILDLVFCGTGPTNPENPVCEICPEPDTLTEWVEEVCDNGIDDDNDSFTDCEDPSCGVGISFVWGQDASCETCSDGKICVLAVNGTDFSIDGGNTWIKPTGWLFFRIACFENLPPGDYEILIKNSKSGCTKIHTTSVNFPPPPPPPSPEIQCEQANLDHNFDGWQAGNGTYQTNITDDLFVIPTMHEIIQSAGFNDPNAPNLSAPPQEAGDFVARVGNMTAGGTSHHLTYCFNDVTNDFDVNFIYAIVLNDPNHAGPSGFQYRVYEQSNPNTNLIGPIITESDDPVLQDGTGSFRYLDWNCNNINVTGEEGQTICLEFLAHGCSQPGHAGYAYVDILCHSDLSPIVFDLNIKNHGESCEDIELDVEGSGEFYNKHNWTLKLLRNGNSISTLNTDVIKSIEPKLDNVFEYFKSNGSKEPVCGDQIEITLNLYNDCTSSSITETIDVPCYTWKSVYPNIIAHNASNSINEDFNLFFNGTNHAVGQGDCSIMNNPITGIKYYRLQVFDRWGNKVFDEEIHSANSNIDGSEIMWDGDFNGTPVVQGVFTWIAYVQSCPTYLDCTNDCGTFTYCSTGELQNVEKQNGQNIQAEVFSDDLTVKN